MNENITELKNEIVYWMLAYIGEVDDEEEDEELEAADPPYAKADVEEFSSIVDTFVLAVESSEEKSDFSWVTLQVKHFVVTLNEFNAKHGHQIIETDQREGICELIDHVIANAGHKVDEDITEEWRDW